MENNIYKYIVYLTMNIVNGKYYIGVHKTDTPWIFDGYLGCGAKISQPSSYNKGKTPLHAAILKYGISNFKRVVLKVCNTIEDALSFEKTLVTKEFISKPCNYNATIGGGIPPRLNKRINQFTLQGEFVKTWDSETDINTFYQSKIQMSDIIKEKRNFAGSFWTFEEVKSINVNEYHKITKRGFIDQYDLSGNYLTSYKSTNIASQKLDIEFKKLNSAIFKRKPCEGYYFLQSGTNIDEIFCKSFKRTANRHPIYRYLKSGEFDKAFQTTAQAKKDTPKATAISLKNAVVNGHLCGGYRWSYSKASNYFDIENPKKYDECPPIEQYDLQGNFIKLWESYKDCKKEFPYCLRVCRGDIKSTGGYIFKYKY